MPSKAIHGIGASPGIAIGPVLRYGNGKLVVEQQRTNDVQNEQAHLHSAIQQAKLEIQNLLQQAREKLGEQEAAIFEAHEMFLEDPDLLQMVQANIQEQQTSAAYAWQEGTKHYAAQLRTLDNEYLAARATDLEDVAQRVLRLLAGNQEQTLHLHEPVIIVANELTPSDTIKLERSKILAFCTATGGPTSHVAILAKALGIPAITSLNSKIQELKDHMQVIIDGATGELFIEPDQETIAAYTRQQQAQARSQQAAFSVAHQPATTLDGTCVEIAANVGAPEHVQEALHYGAEGIGLLRTEFLFMERDDSPAEDEQEAIYRAIFTTMGERPIVVRTFDIGGDKPSPYLHIAAEMNPFLGVRGIRLAFAHPDILQTQLRALLRAGAGHHLKIMFPMVAFNTEIAQIHEQIATAQATLRERGQTYATKVAIGIMIEIPAAALMADVLAANVDFFSIGTNDLTQYTLAIDRTNSALTSQADALHPAVLRLIHMVVEAAHKHGKWVGLCGELGGDPVATPILLGLDLDELSMTPTAIPQVKAKIRQYTMQEAQMMAQHALTLADAQTVRTYIHEMESRLLAL